jgi:GT2 family glycosyltransferase/glycosyltransferase involved in cell wall biosynthesis
MRILVVVHGFPPDAQGGSEIYAHAHARALRQRFGDDVVVLTADQDAGRPEYDVHDVRIEQPDGLRVVRINNTFRNTRTFEETYRNDAIGAIAARVIDDVRPDVAHIHHLTRLSTTIVRSLAERGIPRFVTLHDYWLLCHRGQLLDVDCRLCDGPARKDVSDCGACLGPAAGAGSVEFAGALAVRALERRLPGPGRLLRRAAQQIAGAVSSDDRAAGQSRRRLAHMREVCEDVTHFFAPSRHMRDQFVRFGVAPERITVAGYGFDHAAFRGIAPRAPSDRLRVGFLGSVMISKGPDVLLRAIAGLPRGSVAVDLYGAHVGYHGDDSFRRRLDPLLDQEGVRLHGPVAHDRVAQALSALDVLVVPSIWPENSPLVIQEAFLAGVPVVAARIGGIPEVVDDGRNGLLFSAGDAGDLARVLNRLLREPALLPALRAGIPPVRTIEDDVQAARRVYEAHAAARGAARGRTARVAAVVLNYRTPDDTFLAVKSLLASRRPFDEVIVVDNDREGGIGCARAALQGVWSRITYMSTGANLGFSGGMNAGIREALTRGADRVLLVNSDVIVPPDCVERLEQCLETAPSAGIAGPVVLARSEPDMIASLGMSYSAATGRMRHRGFGDRITDQDRSAARIVDGVSGCLMLVTRRVFDAIGLLDEDYFFSFEDLDFCLRATRAGFTTVLVGTSTAYHEGGRSLDATSPRRLYFAARNHLLVAARTGPAGSVRAALRAASIVALNLAHAALWRGGSPAARLCAVARGTRDYVAGRFGADT